MPDLLDYSLTQLETFSFNASKQLAKAAQSQTETSFEFLRHSLPQQPFVSGDETFQIINIGGTNLETCVVQNQTLQLDTYHAMPLRSMKDASDLATQIGGVLVPNQDKLILNFAYPITPVVRSGKLDGRLIRSTKEHVFEGLIGQLVGEYLEENLSAQIGHEVNIICANDTVCLGLAGLSLKPHPDPQSIIGMVLGSGSNFSLFLDNNCIVNLESGNFNDFDQTPSGLFVDQQSSEPRKHLFEKEVAGVYLYQHFNYYASKLGLSTNLNSSEQLNEVCKGSGREAELAQQLLYRSAGLVAAMLKGIWQFKNHIPLVCLVEGSLFWHGYDYQTYFQDNLGKLGLNSHDTKIIHIDKAGLIGAKELAVYPR